LYHLIYHSQAQVPFDTARLISLLEQSRTANERRGITGLLLYTPAGQFLQVLEGTKQAVTHLYYNLITADPRHKNCTVISEGPWARRSFAAWSMGFLPEGPGALLNIPGYVEFNSLRALLQKWAPSRPALVHMCLEFIARYDDQAEASDLLAIAP
jgi:hypothetical protein